jgi:hypothetical protein
MPMQPIYRWAAASLIVLPAPAIAVPDPMPIPLTQAWLSLGVRPFGVARLLGETDRDRDEKSRSPALGAAPAPARLISFARASIEAPSTSLQMDDAPRFSRQPGRQTDDYAAGLRTELSGGAVALQAGAFYNKFRNLQTSLRQGSGVSTAIAGKAKSYGIEALVRWTPAEQVSLFATTAWREGRLKNRIRDGRKFRLSPDRSAAIGAVLLLPVGEGRIAFTPSLGYQSSMGLGGDRTGRGPVMLVNAQIDYSVGDRIEIAAIAANLLNRRHTRPAAGSAMPLVAAEPRVLGVRARLRY